MPSILLFISLFFGSAASTDTNVASAHEFHLSKTTINYDTEESAIQISTSVFIDDLELSLKEIGYDSLKICTRKEKEEAEQLIHKFFLDHLVIKIDGVDLKPSFLGKEQSDDLAAVWCYLEAFEIQNFKEISITNSILIDQFDDQKNITVVQIDKEKVSHILFTKDKTHEKVAL